MPRRALQTELAEGSLAHLHADPDSRLGLPDGLLVDGHDPFAARRRAMREAHDGRPDPQPAPPKVFPTPPPAITALVIVRCRRCAQGEVKHLALGWAFGDDWWECPACHTKERPA